MKEKENNELFILGIDLVHDNVERELIRVSFHRCCKKENNHCLRLGN